MPTSRSQLDRSLATHGLRLRGGFVPAPAEALPALPGAAPAAVVWMVGQVGSEVWPHFSASPMFRDKKPDPLDRWSKSIGNAMAAHAGGVAVYPSDGPPWFPFQQWATRAEPVQASPLLLQIHPEFGLWHAHRFALVLPELAAADAQWLLAASVAAPDVCLQCEGQPCLSACPVEAFSGTAYAVDRCAAHLHRPQGAECMEGGCLARRACPVGVGQRYQPAHAAFHMQAFLARR